MKIGGPLYTRPSTHSCLRGLFVLLSWYFWECPLVVPTTCSLPVGQRPATESFKAVYCCWGTHCRRCFRKNCGIIMFSALVIQFYVTNHSKSFWFKTVTIYYFSWFCSLAGRVCYWSHFRSDMCLRSAGGQSGLEGSSGRPGRTRALSGLAGSLGHFCLPFLGFCLSRLSRNFFIAWWLAPRREKMWRWYHTLPPSSSN